MGDVAEYLAKHQLEAVLHRMANEVAKARPTNPIDFMIDHLIMVGSQSGTEPAIVKSLRALRETILKDQAEAEEVRKEKAALEKEGTKLDYRVKHLLRTLDEMEAGGAGPSKGEGAAATSKPAAPAVASVPLGHSPFSWAGGVTLAAEASGGSSAPRDALPALREPFSDRLAIARFLKAGKALLGETITVCGWVKTTRKQKELVFIEVNDGSCLGNVQCVVTDQTAGRESDAKHPGMATGASVKVVGTVVESPGAQETELRATSVELLGAVDATTYPLAKKGHSLEFLREIAHLRPRSKAIGAVMRVRNAMAFATHEFFRDHGFLYVHTPLITASDCEGAGEMFAVTTHDLKGGKPYDPSADFFGREAFLTVSGQLNGEYYACAMSSIYTFGPTFRAEPSHTARHLCEFWMIEPEIAFADLGDDMNLAEAYLKHCFAYVLAHCGEDLAFLEATYHKEGEPPLRERLRGIVDEPFVRISYTEAIDRLQQAGKSDWAYVPEWGKELQTEHERYLCEVTFKKPTIVYDYPKECKAFYMRLNDDDRTVAAMDVLFPRVGEMVGGSQREERLDVLLARMRDAGLDMEAYKVRRESAGGSGRTRG